MIYRVAGTQLVGSSNVEIPKSSRPFDSSDVTALAASCVATSITTLVAPGPFSPVNFITGVTLSIIIVGSFLGRPRTWLQTGAVAAGIALSILPATGFLIEVCKRREDLVAALFGEYERVCDRFGQCAIPDSAVKDVEQVVAWLVAFVVCGVLDRLTQPKRA